MVRRDGVTLELLAFVTPDVVGPSGRRPMNQLGLTHLALRVDDVDAVAARVAGSGGAVVGETRTLLLDVDGVRLDFVYCTDPDGRADRADGDRRLSPGRPVPRGGAAGSDVRSGYRVTVPNSETEPEIRRRRPVGGGVARRLRDRSSSTSVRTTSGTPGTPPRPSTSPWARSVDRQAEIPTDRVVVCVCRVGGRSGSWPRRWPPPASTSGTWPVACWPGRRVLPGGHRRRRGRPGHLSSPWPSTSTTGANPPVWDPSTTTWSHLVGDTDEELHEMAGRLGMKRAWFQFDRPASLPCPTTT